MKNLFGQMNYFNCVILDTTVNLQCAKKTLEISTAGERLALGVHSGV